MTDEPRSMSKSALPVPGLRFLPPDQAVPSHSLSCDSGPITLSCVSHQYLDLT